MPQLLGAAGAALLQPRCSFAVGLLPTGKVFDSAANCVGAEPEVSPAHGAGTRCASPYSFHYFPALSALGSGKLSAKQGKCERLL